MSYPAEWVLLRCGDLRYGARAMQACTMLAFRGDWKTGECAYMNPKTVATEMGVRRQQVSGWWKKAREDGIFIDTGERKHGLIVHDVVAPPEGFEAAVTARRGEARELGREAGKEERRAYRKRRRARETHTTAPGREAQIHASPPEQEEGTPACPSGGHEYVPPGEAHQRAPELPGENELQQNDPTSSIQRRDGAAQDPGARVAQAGARARQDRSHRIPDLIADAENGDDDALAELDERHGGLDAAR